MRVLLQRMFFCHLGRFRADPEGTIMPDSLRDILPSDAEVLDEPNEATPVDDPAPVKNSFKEFVKNPKKPMKKGEKQQPIPLSQALKDKE